MFLRVHTDTGTPGPAALGLVTTWMPPVTSTEPAATTGGTPGGLLSRFSKPMVCTTAALPDSPGTLPSATRVSSFGETPRAGSRVSVQTVSVGGEPGSTCLTRHSSAPVPYCT